MDMKPPPLTFTEGELDAANAMWGCNCGPASIAACLDLSLDEVRPHLDDFEKKRHMNPTMVKAALESLGARVSDEWQRGRGVPVTGWPGNGLLRIQWTGPWTKEGANPKWAYQHTHWIASRLAQESRDGVKAAGFRLWIFDASGGWTDHMTWHKETVPALIANHTRADGYYPTHMWWVKRRGNG